MKSKILLAVSLLGLTLTSCDDFLTREPYSKIDSEEFFSNEDELRIYANGLFVNFMPTAADLSLNNTTADNIAVSSFETFLHADFNVDKQSGWTTTTWRDLYRCNYLLQNIDKAKNNVNTATLDHYRGIARFWRAWFYFGMVKTYSNVPWYSNTISETDTAQLYKGRDSRELVMDSVLADLNYACEHLFTDRSYLITKYVAQAFKSRVCLYEGTFRKYHATNPATGLPWEEANGSLRFLNECIKASEDLMNSNAYSLVTGDSTAYRSLFNQETPKTQEIILAREYSADLAATHNVTQSFVSAGNDSKRWSPTQEFVNTYLKRDGSRFTDQPSYENISFVDNCKNRDWRLAQTVITPTYTKKVSQNVVRYNPNWNITLTGYQIIKFNLDDTFYETTGRGVNSFPVFRYAEVLLNEAEAKAELGLMDESVWNKTIKPIRERAGVNGKMPETADPYLIAYYRDKCTDKWLLEIRRERAIELFMEGGNLRYNDLMRWNEGEMLMNQWSSIYIGAKDTPIDSNGDGEVDLAVVDKAPSKKVSGVFYIDLSKNPFFHWQNGRLYITNEAHWTDNKYVHPIPRAALVKNPRLGQNYGWEE